MAQFVVADFREEAPARHTVQMVLCRAHVNVVVHAVHILHVLMRAYYAQPFFKRAEDMSNCSSRSGRNRYFDNTARPFAWVYRKRADQK